MATADLGRLPAPLRGSVTASPVLRTEPESTFGLGPDGRVPHGAWAEYCRKRNAIQAVRDRFYDQYQKLTADMQAEIARIEREGV